jgi:hypothetical protein
MKARNWIAFVVGTLAALGVSYGAYELAGYSWNQVVEYRGPYATVDLPQTPTGELPKVSRRVVFVMIDGLREDVSRTLPALDQLRRHGYDAVVRTGDPALSFPNWTTIFSGAPQRISGVTTNWFEGRVKVETLFDIAARDGVPAVVVGSKDFEQLYGVGRLGRVSLVDTSEKGYKTTRLVDDALRLTKESTAALVVVYSPDIDDAGHDFGGSSTQYLEVAKKVDADLGRLVDALDDGRTTFVVVADHGHIATGGHGGFETEVTDVPVVLAGPDVTLGSGRGTLDQVAPTVAMLAGMAAPRNATGAPLDVVTARPGDAGRFDAQRLAAFRAYTSRVAEGLAPGARTAAPTTAKAAEAEFAKATDDRLALERTQRLPLALGVALAAVAALALIGVLSWRALVAALGGTVAFYLVYNGIFFVVHGYRWSLSAFNSESLLKAFFNARMIEAAVAGIVAAFVAGDVYLMTRKDLKRAKGEYLPGWLALGTATVVAIQATLALQIAWYLWRWGVPVAWVLPDFEWAFKYDLDLIQVTALAVAALVAPVVTFLVGRYHPFPGERWGRRPGAGVASEKAGPGADPAASGRVDEA